MDGEQGPNNPTPRWLGYEQAAKDKAQGTKDTWTTGQFGSPDNSGINLRCEQSDREGCDVG